MCERLSTCQQLDVVDWDFGHILEKSDMGGRKEEREAGRGSSRMRTAPRLTQQKSMMGIGQPNSGREERG